LAIWGGALTVVAVILMPETNPHIILQRRAKALRKKTGENKWHARAGVEVAPTKLLLQSLYRPMKVFSYVYRI
jgi:hypothetical protein